VSSLSRHDWDVMAGMPAAGQASAALPPRTANEMLAAARDSFVHGLHLASGAGAAVLLATAVAAWFLLRGQELEDTQSV
ncbi:hypothetical protein AB0D38_03980, partial [Streptomyces sp. NPDC048279]